MKIFTQGRKPNSIYSDDGKEFKSEYKKFLEDHDVKIFITTTENKAAVVERFNRTLKEKMYRYFTYMKDQVKKQICMVNDTFTFCKTWSIRITTRITAL